MKVVLPPQPQSPLFPLLEREHPLLHRCMTMKEIAWVCQLKSSQHLVKAEHLNRGLVNRHLYEADPLVEYPSSPIILVSQSEQ